MSSFASDNHSGAHPAVLRALERANRGHCPAYGEDPLTLRVERRLARLFGPRAGARLVLTGTAANVIGLRCFTESYHAVFCAASAHLHRHECAAPETFLGAQIVPIPAPDGKLTPALLKPHLRGFGDPHEAQPRAISISQSTEYGTVYSPAEVRALARLAHRHGMILHVDGARLANAAAGLGVPLRTLCAGVDVLSFGGTKNGLIAAEAVVLLRPAPAFPYFRKQGMQLASKMRFVSAQFLALLEGDLWLKNARQANAMARRLEASVRGLPGLEITQPVQANAVFARLPRRAIGRLQKRFAFYAWDEARDEVRWMTSFDTRPAEVDAFATAIRRELTRGEPGRTLTSRRAP